MELWLGEEKRREILKMLKLLGITIISFQEKDKVHGLYMKEYLIIMKCC
jgi:hypothetical protein